MTSSFNLIDDPWVPVRFVNVAEKQAEVSMREALARAPDIAEITHPSPVIVVAIHRLLLSVLHRVFGPKGYASWTELWEGGSFDSGQICSYLDEWHERFELFHPERPFYQAADLPESAATSIAKLGHAFSAGNNSLLFDHSQDVLPPALPVAEAARLLIAQQGFAIGGLIARLPGDPPSAEAGHLVKGAVCLATGDNLFETLVLNMVRLAGDESTPFEFPPGEDRPAWEADPPAAVARPLAGYLDLLTWQSRRVRLLPDEHGATVSRAVIMAGNRFPAGYSLKDKETMVAYSVRDVPKGQDPWAPIGFRVEKALWRDSLALLGAVDERRARPANLRWLAELHQSGYLDGARTFSVAAYGLSSDRAKVFLWRREDLPLPLAYLTNTDLRTLLGRGIEAAEKAATALRSATRALASETLGPGGTADKDRVTALADSLATARAYWPALDLPFRTFMVDLAATYEADIGAPACEAWADEILRAAEGAFDQGAAALETSGRGFRAAAAARPRFRARLRKALEELQPAPTKEESQ